MNIKTLAISAAIFGLLSVATQADPLVIDMHYVTAEGVGKKIGTVTATKTPYGTLFTPRLMGISPGLHGFHVHEKGSCEPGEKEGLKTSGLKAGSHYDPEGTGTHKGPYGDGHLGDLPALYVDTSGAARHPVLAPRLELSDLDGRTLMIHARGDNYSDLPNRLGGGGERIACGVIGP